MVWKILLAAVVLVLFWGISAQAVTVTTADSNGADTFLSNDSQSGGGPDVVHGAENSLAIRRYDGTRQKIGYIRFDLTGITGDLTGATLSFNVTSSNRTRVWGIYGLFDGPDDLWNEAMISYSNAPGMVAAAIGSYAINADKLQKLGTINIVNAPAIYISNTTDLNLDSFIINDKNKRLTFAVIPETTDSTASWYVTSKEGGAALAPVLTLPYAIPEPVTIAMLGLGGLTLLRRRRA
jgi:hypothetical protein